MPIYTVQGKVTSIANGLPVPVATVEVFGVEKVGNNFITTAESTTPVPIVTDFTGHFSATFNYPHPQNIKRPNIIFRVSQKTSGIVTYIYNENPATDTRWAIADVLNVNLKVSGNAVVIHTPQNNQPIGNYFVFTRIGNIGVNNISQSNGLAHPTNNPQVGGTGSNQPFGSTLWIGGWFGIQLMNNTNLTYYKIQYAPGVQGPNGPGPWTNITDPLINTHYDFVNQQWVNQMMGPLPNPFQGLYMLPTNTGNVPWIFPDLLITWDTTKVAGGLYTLRVLGYDSNGIPLPGGSLGVHPDPSYGTLKTEIDNTLPNFKIIGITQQNGTINLTPCNFADFDTNGPITIQFEAYDANGNLGSYSLDAYYGHNQVVLPRPNTPNKATDSYGGQGNVAWQGQQIYSIDYKPADYNTTEMPQCAYEFRLRLDKRTTNGYGLVYWGYEDTWHITIIRP